MKRFPTKKKLCIHFSKCSGCKYKRLKDFSKKYNEIFEFAEKISSEKIIINQYRNEFSEHRKKAKLAISKEKDRVNIGLYQENTHFVWDIENCLAHDKNITLLIKHIKKILIDEKISIFNPQNKKGLLKYIQFFVSNTDKKVQLSLVINSNKNDNIDYLKNFAEKLFRFKSKDKSELIDSIWVNFKPVHSNTIFSKDWLLLVGKKFLINKIGKYKFAFHPASFSQANFSLFIKMIKNIAMEISKDKNILELYSGNGSIALNFADKSHKTVLVESNPFSKISFEKTIEINSFKNLKNISFHNIKAEEFDFDKQSFDYVLVDPPRKGVDKKILEKICFSSNIETFIYISCSFESFKRDALFLHKNGFLLSKLDLYHFFPRTDHIEICSIFKRKSG